MFGLKFTRRVLIVGDGSVTCLGVLKSLRFYDIPVLVISTNNNGCCLASKYAKYEILPDPEYYPNKFLSMLIKDVERNEGDVLLPTSDKAVEIISKNKTMLEQHYTVPVPDWSVIKYCLLKELTYEVAKKMNISMPKTFHVTDYDHLKEIAKNIDYPCIIKPSSNDMRYLFRKKVIEIRDSKNLLNMGKKFLKLNFQPLIQEIIPGPPNQLYSFCSVLDYEGNPIGIFTGRKIRQFPYDFGVCTVGESLWDQEIMRLGLSILQNIGYVGISQVEFKLDTRDGEYKLLEINPRPWYWISLPTFCGVNFPLILYRFVNGENVCLSEFREKIKWHHLIGDLSLLGMQTLQDKRMFPFSQYLNSYLGPRTFATFSLYDFKPFLQEVKQFFSAALFR